MGTRHEEPGAWEVMLCPVCGAIYDRPLGGRPGDYHQCRREALHRKARRQRTGKYPR